MANELAYWHHTTGLTVYGIVRDPATGKVRDVVAPAWDTLADADWGDYDVPMAEAGTASKLYQANAPADLIGAGQYEYGVFIQAGGSPAVTDQMLAVGTFGDDVYFCSGKLNLDSGNSQDEYSVEWFRNGVPITSGITNAKIQVVTRASGADLVALTAMEEVGSTGAFRYDESAERLTAGQAALAIFTATIDGATRTRRMWVGRDV